MLAGSIALLVAGALIIVGIVLGIFFPLFFIVAAVGVALLIVSLVNGSRERRAATTNRVE